VVNNDEIYIILFSHSLHVHSIGL